MAKAKMINPLTDGNEHLREPEEYIERHVIRPAEDVVTATRYVEVDGKKFTIQRMDPYGFWNILPPTRGKLHESLRSKYTTAKLAEHAIEHYVNVTLPAEKAAEASAS